MWIYILKKKLKVFESLLACKSLVKNQTNRKMKVLRTDNGGELCGKEFDLLCKHHHIDRQKITPYMPQQNRVTNRTLMEKTRSMIGDAGLSHDYCAEAINIASYVVNKLAMSALVYKTSYEVWDGKRHLLAHIIVFGCDAFVHIPKERRQKLDNKSEKLSSLGTRT